MVVKGRAQGLRALLYLIGTYMGIMHPHVMKHLNKLGEIGRNVDCRTAYTILLFPHELHIIVRLGLESFDDLRGKRVNFGELGSGPEISLRIIVYPLGMQVE